MEGRLDYGHTPRKNDGSDRLIERAVRTIPTKDDINDDTTLDEDFQQAIGIGVQAATAPHGTTPTPPTNEMFVFMYLCMYAYMNQV